MTKIGHPAGVSQAAPQHSDRQRNTRARGERYEIFYFFIFIFLFLFF
jgi:hypothetical protein